MTAEKSTAELLVEVNAEIKKYDNVIETVTFNGHWRHLITLLVKKTQLLEDISLNNGPSMIREMLEASPQGLNSSVRVDWDKSDPRYAEFSVDASEVSPAARFYGKSEDSILTNEDLAADKGFIEKTSDYIKDKIKKK